jgi:hypothetical protein
MHLINVDDPKLLKPRVSVIWSSSSSECRLEAPFFAMMSGDACRENIAGSGGEKFRIDQS